MQTRNELGFLVSSRYYSSDFKILPKTPKVSSESPTPTTPEQSTPLNQIMGSSQSSPSLPEGRSNNNGPNLLTIPLEIRLHIYHYVLLTHPIHHAHLAPLTPAPNFSGLNTEEFHTTMIRSSSAPAKEIEITTRTLLTSLPHPKSDSESQQSYISAPLLSPSQHPQRIQGKIPTALLTASKQIYAETSHLPWYTNTFSFINWFWSGVYAARSFTRGLPEWQRDAVRCVSPGDEAIWRET
ncbi:hypothetical protein BKA65DRAFT_180377 [Rhexocercosporidium sp. MPI-PUGE-AT-0058]|nr:hypothetical protein BKA65DRAFT_180377 [Rhexocercosporidium sp. MPI-PUGE-AT-0058]